MPSGISLNLNGGRMPAFAKPMWFLALTVLGTFVGCLLDQKALASGPTRDGLVLEYRLEGNARDSSGYGRNGTLHGKPQFVPGRIGLCLALDGKQDYVDCGTNLGDLGQTFTVECWVNPADRQNLHADLFGNHNHGAFGFVVEQDGSRTNHFTATYGAGSHRWIGTPPVALTPGKWQHLALVKTPTELRLYLNGIPVAATRNEAPMVPSPLTLRVGDSIGDTSRCFCGLIDEFRVWKKAITEFDLSLSPQEKLDAFAQAARIRLTPGSGSKRERKTTWTLMLDQPLVPIVPPGVKEIVVSLEAEDWQSDAPINLPPVKLNRQSGFRSEFEPPLKPGYYRFRCKPFLAVGSRHILGQQAEFSGPIIRDPADSAVFRPDSTPQAQAAKDATRLLPLDGEGWLMAVDPRNEGRRQKWYESPVKEARSARVPGVIQDVFPDYHGVAWYWRDLPVPAHFQPQGRYLLKFHAVDYLAEVWVNGVAVGGHEGGETPFVLDITQVVKPGQVHRLAVRVLNPTYEPIEGYALKQTPSGAKQYPVATNAVYNCGGIVDSVDLLLTPAVRIVDVYAAPNWKSGEIRVRAAIHNAASREAPGTVQFRVAPAAGGPSLCFAHGQRALAPGETQVEARLQVPNHRLWCLNDPYLYRVTTRVQVEGASAEDEQTIRCGFRDFRFQDGYFRLNGQRIFLHGVIHLAHYPVGHTWPVDLDWMRRDVLHMKTVGINLCRFAFGGSLARQLDLFDELGVMVYMEHYASWQLQDSPQMKRRFERSLGEIVLRDRNHPSIVAWGMLNETAASDPAFRHGVESLPLVRWLDPDRLCILNSGRWDGDMTLGSLSNPGSSRWESDLRDVHGYPPVPFRAELLRSMRSSRTPEGLWSGVREPEKADPASHPLFVSEYGQCGAVDLARTVRRFEQMGKQQTADGRYYRRQLDNFLVDWKTWRLDQIWARPEDFFTDSHANFVKLRRIGENALRANPHLVAFSSTHPIAETGFCGSGTTNAFRELKPGLMDAAYELAAPLRWGLFVEPASSFRGTNVQLEAVLANEDVLRPGKYSVRLQVVGPGAAPIWEKVISVEIPPRRSGQREPPFALPVFTGSALVDGPPGQYRFLATFLDGGAAMGGQTEFYIDDPATMPALTSEVLLWGDDPELHRWLTQKGIRTRRFVPGQQTAREVILASGKPPAPGGGPAFAELARRMARGSTVVFVDPGLWREGQNATQWLPLKRKGMLAPIDWVGGYYRADVWAKAHPIMAGLPAGGLLDPVFFREILPPHVLLKNYTVGRGFVQDEVTTDLDPPAEAVCGANRLSANYSSGLHVAIYRLGAGRFILNTLLIRENLGRVPAAERLLRNMLIHAGSERDKPLAELPGAFPVLLKAIGYER